METNWESISGETSASTLWRDMKMNSVCGKAEWHGMSFYLLALRTCVGSCGCITSHLKT